LSLATVSRRARNACEPLLPPGAANAKRCNANAVYAEEQRRRRTAYSGSAAESAARACRVRRDAFSAPEVTARVFGDERMSPRTNQDISHHAFTLAVVIEIFSRRSIDQVKETANETELTANNVGE